MKKSNYLFALALGASTLTYAQVGIGTSSPSNALDIETTGPAVDINDTGGGDPEINLQVSGVTTFSIGIDNSDSDKLKIGTTAPDASTRMTIDGSGNVGIGTSTPSSLVEISSGTDGDAVLTLSADTDNNNDADNPGIELSQDGGVITGFIALEGSSGTKATNTLGNSFIIGSETGSTIQWVTSDDVKMTLSGSYLGIGTTSPAATLHVEGTVRGVVDGGNVAAFDRLTSDGNIVAFQQDGSVEGTISVSGTTISYNAFTGSHYAYSKEETFERGMLVSFNGKNEHFHNNPKSEILYGINYSAKANDEKVAGVFLSLCESREELSLDNPYQIMAVGNGDVWVTDEGGDIVAGDYLISSSTVGHAMKDNGDYEVSHVFAKATESVDWSTVQPDSNGVKRKKIIVYFESFDKPNYEKKFREQQALNVELKAELDSKTSTNAEEIEALKAQVQQLLQLIQQQESASVGK